METLIASREEVVSWTPNRRKESAICRRAIYSLNSGLVTRTTNQ